VRRLPETFVVLLCASAVLAMIACLLPYDESSDRDPFARDRTRDIRAEQSDLFPGLVRDLRNAGPTTWILAGLGGAFLLAVPFTRGARGRLCLLVALLALLLGTGGAALGLREAGRLDAESARTTWEVAPGLARCFASLRLTALAALAATLTGIVLSIREDR
jgi:hypothetical protein